jgi:hypothetical protein
MSKKSARRLCRKLCKWRRVSPHLYPHATEANQLRAIHSEHLNGCLACWRQTDDFCAFFIPGKMVCPLLLLRMKEWNGLTQKRSNGSLPVRFIAVAGRARQTQILEDRFTPCTSGHDMFDFEDCYCKRLSCLTVGTTIRELCTNLAPQCGRDVYAHDVCNTPV